MSETFEEWWDLFEMHCLSSDGKITVTEIVQSAWTHQQKKIDELEKDNKELVKHGFMLVEQKRSLEEKLKLKTSNEVQASVNADCLVQVRGENKELKAKLAKAVEALKSIANLEAVDKELDASVWFAKTAIQARKTLEEIEKGE